MPDYVEVDARELRELLAGVGRIAGHVEALGGQVGELRRDVLELHVRVAKLHVRVGRVERTSGPPTDTSPDIKALRRELRDARRRRTKIVAAVGALIAAIVAKLKGGG